jgi:hypothetical protein
MRLEYVKPKCSYKEAQKFPVLRTALPRAYRRKADSVVESAGEDFSGRKSAYSLT